MRDAAYGLRHSSQQNSLAGFRLPLGALGVDRQETAKTGSGMLLGDREREKAAGRKSARMTCLAPIRARIVIHACCSNLRQNDDNMLLPVYRASGQAISDKYRYAWTYAAVSSDALPTLRNTQSQAMPASAVV